MNEPDAQLMRRYGTEDVLLMKQAMPGGYALAGRIALAIAAMRGAHYVGQGLQDAQAQAAAVNNRIRALEQLRAMEISVPMRYTRPPMILPPRIGGGGMGMMGMGMGGGRDLDAMAAEMGGGQMDPAVLQGGDIYGVPVGMDQGMVRTAAAVGRRLAKRAEADKLVKQAMGSVPGADATRQLAKKFLSAPGPSASSVANAVAPVLNKGVPGVAGAAAKPSMWARSMAGGKWKTTVPAVAALGAVGVVGAKGMQGVANKMSQENHPADWGNLQQGVTRPAFGVGQWGHPTIQSPFISG